MSLLPITYRYVNRRVWKNFDESAFGEALARSDICCVQNDGFGQDVDGLCVSYNTIAKNLLDNLAPFRSSTFRERPSNIWFDADCRIKKASVRALERHYRLINDVSDRALWFDGLRAMHSFFNHKKSIVTMDKINKNKDNPRKLWRTLTATLGVVDSRPETKHTAEDFAQFFDDKVNTIRQLTSNAPPPTFLAHPLKMMSPFVTISTEDVVKREPDNSDALRDDMLRCIGDVSSWMSSNRLSLNPTKTEFMLCATTH